MINTFDVYYTNLNTDLSITKDSSDINYSLLNGDEKVNTRIRALRKSGELYDLPQEQA